MHAPRTSYLEVVIKILRYLKGTPGKEKMMKTNNSNDVYGYSDVDCVESFDRKSTTDFYAFVGRNLVKWKSKK
jgi:hypothetical protein